MGHDLNGTEMESIRPSAKHILGVVALISSVRNQVRPSQDRQC